MISEEEQIELIQSIDISLRIIADEMRQMRKMMQDDRKEEWKEAQHVICKTVKESLTNVQSSK